MPMMVSSGFGPGAVDGDFVGEQALIEREGTLEGVEVRVGRGVEAASPEAVVFAFGGGHFYSPSKSNSRSMLRHYRIKGGSTISCFLRLWLSGAPLLEARTSL